ncbi:MAG: carboxylating nicotinate-nucleotide diphosphorylase [Candidatus Zixiibacteriota bacterium]
MDVEQSIRRLVRIALEEDVGPGDVTSLACLDPAPLRAVIVAKSAGVLSGVKPAALAFQMVDTATKVAPQRGDGNAFAAGDTIMKMEGFNQPILAAERAALNFLARLSGIATLTARFVEAIRGTSCRILDTRKTTPGWRLLEKQAVVDGGGGNHRLGLYDMILIKDNHIAAAGSVNEAVRKAREYLSSGQYEAQFGSGNRKPEIEVEVSNEEELKEAIACGADRMLLDNQSVDSLERLVKTARKINSGVKLEASGNVTLDNVAAIAATGVDFISIGALTHSAPACDFSMKVIS